ncbi:MAG: hypothetical protein RLZZ49_135 [Bacteroidota bacterium]|jgi:hypothetical protein
MPHRSTVIHINPQTTTFGKTFNKGFLEDIINNEEILNYIF